jgi:hypothetical protein
LEVVCCAVGVELKRGTHVFVIIAVGLLTAAVKKQPDTVSWTVHTLNTKEMCVSSVSTVLHMLSS